jgi:hypothetical protein
MAVPAVISSTDRQKHKRPDRDGEDRCPGDPHRRREAQEGERRSDRLRAPDRAVVVVVVMACGHRNVLILHFVRERQRRPTSSSSKGRRAADDAGQNAEDAEKT